MPLRVHCPSGCFIRMPSNRAGKMVRCPECKKVIRLGTISQSELQSGKPIPMSADPVANTETEEPDSADILPSIDATASDQPEIEIPGERIDPLAAIENRPRLMVPRNIEPPSVRHRKSGKENFWPKKTRSEMKGKTAPRPAIRLDHDKPGAMQDDIPRVTDSVNSQAGLRRRVSSANADRALLSKFFAICLCLVAAINLGPAIYYWVQWSQTFESTALPRWIYLQVFIAALHVIYAVYLVQIRDWSALKAVSFAMLAVAFIFGLVSTGLLAGGGQGLIAQFLELPHVLTSQASIWCVAMLCLSTLMCYMGGRVAVNWQRTEQLLREIIS